MRFYNLYWLLQNQIINKKQTSEENETLKILSAKLNTTRRIGYETLYRMWTNRIVKQSLECKPLDQSDPGHLRKSWGDSCTQSVEQQSVKPSPVQFVMMLMYFPHLYFCSFSLKVSWADVQNQNLLIHMGSLGCIPVWYRRKFPMFGGTYHLHLLFLIASASASKAKGHSPNFHRHKNLRSHTCNVFYVYSGTQELPPIVC